MKKIVVAALLVGAIGASQASACELNHQPITRASQVGVDCMTQPPPDLPKLRAATIDEFADCRGDGSDGSRCAIGLPTLPPSTRIVDCPGCK